MSDRLYVSTRKGLFTLVRNSSGWTIEKTDFLGSPVSMFLQDERDGSLYAALNHQHFGVKLHRSFDCGETWEECTVPVYPQTPEESSSDSAAESKDSAGTTLDQIFALEGTGPDRPDQLWAGTIPGGLFRSMDRGTTWELVESLWNCPERQEWFGGGMDLPAINSICVDPRDSAHVSIGVSIGGVWVTRDAGETWKCQASGMRAEYLPPDKQLEPNLQDVHLLVNCKTSPDAFWVQHHNGIFRTTDDCNSWQELENVQPSGFGFAVVVHPNDPDTAWFVPGVKDECRIPVDGKLVVTRTSDGGQTFESCVEGLPQEHAYDIAFRHAMDVDETGERLSFGSTTGSLWISENSGDSWTCISTNLPPIRCVRFHA